MKELKKASNSLETRRIRKILNEEVRLGISPNSDSETEDVDLHKELYPLGHYINNREEMIEQMFSIIKGAKLKKMLPPILKDMPLDELKADCLIHLLGMSKKRIRAILEGREIDSSSDSESLSDSPTTPNKKSKTELKPFIIKQEGCSDISDNSEEVVLVDPDLDFLNLGDSKKPKTEEVKKPKRKLKRRDLDKKHKKTKKKVVEEVSESDEVQQVDSSAESTSDNEMETETPKEGKTLLEILELEMRARAIRALLKNNDPEDNEEAQNSNHTNNLGDTKKETKKQSKENSTKKITPAKNFRKKKRKSDDVIVITPKVVTIDLTDENEQTNSSNNVEKNVVSSPKTINMDKDSINDKSQNSNKGDQSSVSDTVKSIIDSEELLKTKDTIIEKVIPCTEEESSTDKALDKSSSPDQNKNSWAQRWLESKEVKKVVSTSKICGNIRKKIKSAKLAKKQTPSQEEPDKPLLPAPEKEIEGSVVEYELLPRSKITISNDDGVDSGTQASVISADSDADLTASNLAVTAPAETSIAEQVQDVSSTKSENNPTNSAHDFGWDHQVKEVENVNNAASSNSGAEKLGLNDEITIRVENHEKTTLLSTTEIAVDSDPKCLNQNDDSHINEKNYDIEETKQISLNQNGMNVKENREVVEDHDRTQTENTCPEILDPNTNSSNECDGSLPSNGNNTKHNIEFKSHSLMTETCVNEDKREYDINDSNVEPNEGDLAIEHLSNEPRNNENVQKDTNFLEACNNLNSSASVCGEKPALELNEPETLEINITDEDRDIEDLVEEINGNQTDEIKTVVID